MNAFDVIYRDNLWNGAASRSGPGSGWEPTINTSRSITALVDILGITSVVDMGCGDGLWMPELPGYIGIDVSAEAVALARRNHPDRHYLLDTGEALPWADLYIIRDVIQHLSLDDGTALLHQVRDAAPDWLLASTYLDGRNVPIRSGLDERGRYTFFTPDLSARPYDQGQPLLLIADGWDYRTGMTVRDGAKFLGLWDLRP